MYRCICINIYVYMYRYIHVYIYENMIIHVNIYIHVYMYILIHTLLHLYIHIHACTYTTDRVGGRDNARNVVVAVRNGNVLCNITCLFDGGFVWEGLSMSDTR